MFMELKLNKTCLLQERELEEWQLEEKRQANIRAVVEEERQKLLKEHASKLLGYLPRVSDCLLNALHVYSINVLFSWLV